MTDWATPWVTWVEKARSTLGSVWVLLSRHLNFNWKWEEEAVDEVLERAVYKNTPKSRRKIKRWTYWVTTTYFPLSFHTYFILLLNGNLSNCVCTNAVTFNWNIRSSAQVLEWRGRLFVCLRVALEQVKGQSDSDCTQKRRRGEKKGRKREKRILS